MFGKLVVMVNFVSFQQSDVDIAKMRVEVSKEWRNEVIRGWLVAIICEFGSKKEGKRIAS